MPPFGKIEPTFSDHQQVSEPEEVAIDSAENSAKLIAEKVADGADMEDSAVLYNEQPIRINKKKLYRLIALLAISIAAAIVFATDMYKIFSKEDNTSNTKTVTIPKQPATYIDDNEEQNKLLKNDTKAKQENVNIFEFDINKCLEKYSEAQCVDMFEKNMLINEKR